MKGEKKNEAEMSVEELAQNLKILQQLKTSCRIKIC